MDFVYHATLGLRVIKKKKKRTLTRGEICSGSEAGSYLRLIDFLCRRDLENSDGPALEERCGGLCHERPVHSAGLGFRV